MNVDCLSSLLRALDIFRRIRARRYDPRNSVYYSRPTFSAFPLLSDANAAFCLLREAIFTFGNVRDFVRWVRACHRCVLQV